MDYFFYGTLMDEDVLARVAKRRFAPGESEAAWLDGFRCRFVEGAWYPMLVADADGRVRGRLVRDIAPAEAERIHYFEGDEYEPQTLPVTTRRGTVTATTFMAKPTLKASEEPWDLTRWRRRHKRIYLMRLARWLPDEGAGRD